MNVDLESHPTVILEDKIVEEGDKKFTESLTLSPVAVKIFQSMIMECGAQTEESRDILKKKLHKFELGNYQAVEGKESENFKNVVDPSKTVVMGNGIYGSSAGVVANFSIFPMDVNGNPLLTTHLQLLLRHNMSERHSKYLKINLIIYLHFPNFFIIFDLRFSTNCEPNFCIVHYICIEAGSYFMNLLIDDRHIAGSPFIVKITPGSFCHFSKCYFNFFLTSLSGFFFFIFFEF